MLSSGWLASYVGQSEVPALITSLSSPSFDSETFLHVLHGKQYDKQVQGGSVLIIEPGTLCVSQKPKALCVKF